MSHSPSIPDRPAIDLDPNLSDPERLDALKDHLGRIADINEELADRLEAAEDRRDGLRDEVDHLQRENELLKTASLYVATVQEVMDESVVVKQHGNNQEVLTDLEGPLGNSLEAGDRVAVNDSFAVQSVLDDETDSRAQAMEITDSPGVRYDDIGGLVEQIRDVREAVEIPLEHPERFVDVGIEPPSGVLLHGPPGTGKTMLAKAVANHADATFIRMAGSELVHKFIGEGARLVRDLFELAEQKEPAILFIDEIDAIASKRTDSKTSGDAEVQRTMMQLLSEMDGFDDRGEVRLIAATNRFDMLDEAILRPGRFDRLIEVPMPDEDARERIFEIHAGGMNLADGVDFESLARDGDGFSGADIKAVCTEAGMVAIRDERTAVTMADFESAKAALEGSGRPGARHPTSLGFY
jgi:proteasome regulatory subunit